MNVDDLKSACQSVIDSGGEAVVLVIPRGVRLCGRRGPIGELLCTHPDGYNVVRFKAAAVLRFLERETKK